MLKWSESREPDKTCRYNHVCADTPLGRIYIEWKGWKDYPSYYVLMYVENDMIFDVIESSLEDAQSATQEKWDKLSAQIASLATAERITQ